MGQSFHYKLESGPGTVTASVRQFCAKRFALSLAWTVFWLWAAYAAARANDGFLGWLGMFFSIVLAILGLLIANYTLRTSRLVITTATLEARMRTLFTLRTRTLSMESIRGFGFGHYGHSCRPVLKFEDRSTWHVLATDVEEAEALKFVQEIEARGVIVP
jgi:hypothetical protein